MQVTVSIITPTYNVEATLLKCVESVAQQTFANIEHIIIDGVSQDKTLTILKELNSKYEHLRYVSEKDKGIYDAMNKGISMAKGDWLYFLGADDYFTDKYVLAKIFEQNELMSYDVLYGDVYSTRFQGRYDGEFDGEKIVKKNICHQALFFHKSVFEKTGNFDLRFKGHADWDHNLRWFLNRNISRKYIPLVVANYADGGFSSINRDENFSELKQKLVLQYDKGVLPYRYKASLAKAFARNAFNEKKIMVFIKYLFLFIKTRIQLAISR